MIGFFENNLGVQFTDKDGTYKLVRLEALNPECKGCQEDCRDCCANLSEPDTFVLTVRYKDWSTTRDSFNSFQEAFESFSNIVKMFAKEESQKLPG